MPPMTAPLNVPNTGRMLPATAPIKTPFRVGENLDALAAHAELAGESCWTGSKADDGFSVLMLLSMADGKRSFQLSGESGCALSCACKNRLRFVS